MYKALIIDDELPARRAIRALGQWDKHHITELYEADNGQQGLEFLAAKKPDVVFIDMKMPVLGGVEFMEKAGISAAKFIVISGYDDFAYARSALQSGAVDYLLKPIKRSELDRALAKAVEQLDHGRRMLERELESGIVRNISVPLVKEKIFASIIGRSGRLHRMEELAGFIDAKPGHLFYVIAVLALNAADVCRDKFGGDAYASDFAITNALNELLGSLGEAFSFKNGRDEQEIVAVLSTSDTFDARAGQESIGRALSRLKETFGFDCIASFEADPRTIEQLDVSYHAARSILMKTDLLNPQPVQVREADPEPMPDSILTKQEALLQALDTGSSAYAVSLLRQYFHELRGNGRFPAVTMARTIAEFRVLLEHIAKETAAVAANRLTAFDAEFRQPLMRFEQFEQRTLAFFSEVFEQQAESRKQAEKFDIDKVKQYIERHFHEDIPIAVLSETFYLSKEHLHRLFKQKFQCGIHEYTLKLRMEKAKELLADPRLKIQTVCGKVGFHDQNYFSKAFKKHCGVSPLEFRLSLASSGEGYDTRT